MVNGFPPIDGPKPSSENHSGDISVGPHLYSLYFKGLVSQGSLAGFGVAILGQNDDLLFQMKGPIHGSNITVLEAELTALKQGLTEAVDLGINHITIYVDSHPIHELVTGRSVPNENKSALLMNDVQRIRERFSSSFPMFVSEDSIQYAYKLARETIVSEISIPVDPPRQPKPARKMTCLICLDGDVNADQIYTVDICRHRFCFSCMKRYIEVRILEGYVMACPHFRCKSTLSLKSCANLVTPNLRAIWKQRIKEDSIPFADRIYCPNPKCSALMRKTELSKFNKEAGVKRCCNKCGEPFCTNCKVPWHDNLSCIDYMLHQNPTENDGKLQALANQKMWRQCEKCQHMIELSEGCVSLICRCGHKFCYQCGAKTGNCTHGHEDPPLPQQLPSPPPRRPPLLHLILLLFLILVILYVFLQTKGRFV